MFQGWVGPWVLHAEFEASHSPAGGVWSWSPGEGTCLLTWGRGGQFSGPPPRVLIMFGGFLSSPWLTGAARLPVKTEVAVSRLGPTACVAPDGAAGSVTSGACPARRRQPRWVSGEHVTVCLGAVPGGGVHAQVCHSVANEGAPTEHRARWGVWWLRGCVTGQLMEVPSWGRG